jgi:hypothetical protein
LLLARHAAIPRPRPRPLSTPPPAQASAPPPAPASNLDPKADPASAAEDAPTIAETPSRPPESGPTLVSQHAPRATLQSIDLESVAVAPPRASSLPPPLPERARRERPREPVGSRPEIVDRVFSSLRDLAFFETPVEAASFALVTALAAVPSLAGLALLRDDEHGGYAVVYARGPRSHCVVRARIDDDDAAVGLALVRGGPVAIEYGSDLPPPERHAAFGDPWAAFAVPIRIGDCCIGFLELVDPLDGRMLGESARHALTTIADHVAALVGDRLLFPGLAFAPEQIGLED